VDVIELVNCASPQFGALSKCRLSSRLPRPLGSFSPLKADERAWKTKFSIQKSVKLLILKLARTT
jgi:hypothetical protein